MAGNGAQARILVLRTPYWVARERASVRIDEILDELEEMRVMLALGSGAMRRTRKEAWGVEPFTNVVPFRKPALRKPPR